MSPIYRVFQPLFKLALGQFYTRMVIEGDTPSRTGPLLVVANHPNYMLDPLVLLSSVQRELWFLAKSPLFQWPWGVLLKRLHMIPIYRKQDGSPEQTVQNKETFKKVVEKLHDGAAIALFPEGVSLGERKLHPLKTGAARMSFQAEEERDFELGLRIIPVGITYSDFDRFRSSVTVAFGEPIQVSEYRSAYSQDAVQAVRQLTDEIESRLRSVTVELDDLKHQELVDMIGKLYASSDQDGVSDRERLSKIVENIEALGNRFPEQRARFESRIQQFVDLCDEMAIDPDEPLSGSFDYFFVLLASPFTLFGLLTHYPVYRFIDWIVRKRNFPQLKRGSMKLAHGMVLYPVWYLSLTLLAYWLAGSGALACVVLALLLWAGYCVNNYWQRTRMLLLTLSWPGRANPMRIIRLIRDELIREIDEIRLI